MSSEKRSACRLPVMGINTMAVSGCMVVVMYDDAFEALFRACFLPPFF